MKYPVIHFEFLKNQLPEEAMICHACGVFESPATSTCQSCVHPVTEHLSNKPFYKDVVMPLIEESTFTGEKGTIASANCFYNVGKVMVVGLGKKEAISQQTIREAASLLCRTASSLHTKAMVVDFDNLLQDKSNLQAFVEGILLTAHCDERFKSKQDAKITHLERVYFMNATADEATIELARSISKGVYLARELANAPANHVTPTFLAQTARVLADKYHLELKVLEKEDCEKLAMGAYLSVAQGSDQPPKFIHLCYKPKSMDGKTSWKKVALIGKGVTFDSGGLNLKVGNSHIEWMKYDMSGTAAVLGVAEAIGMLQPNKEIHFIIAATENMINGKASKPGDVVTASNGKTIEVNNTDAEGRLTLADALVYAEKLGVDAIVDLATLTGSIVVALGERIAGLFATDQKLIDGLMQASPRTGEKIWPMPLEEGYVKWMDSVAADISNVAEKCGGGSITAALFLKEFVHKTAWAHIDIAGPVCTKEAYTYHNVGGTGFGVRI